MKHILLAKKSKRIFAGLIDFLIILISTLIIFFTLVYPLAFNEKQYRDNFIKLKDIFQESGLYVTNDLGEYAGKCTFTNSFKSIGDLNDVTIDVYDKQFKENLSKDLYLFYTTKYTSFGHDHNLSDEAYMTTVLEIGTSNIASIDMTTFAINMVDVSKENETIQFFLTKYEAACYDVNNYAPVVKIKNENNDLMFGVIALIIPVTLGVAFITHFIIPIFSKCRRTIGKHIFKLDVIASTSYQLKWHKLLLRYVVYAVVEVIGGIVTFGGLFLITYTMFIFSKNRRSIHDFVCKSVVIDGKDSVYFLNEKEEEYFNARKKNEKTNNII